MYDFEYTDPIDNSVSKKQGQVVQFADGSRVVFRLSGTGSQGATVRMYVERYVPPEAGEKELSRDAADGLKGLIEVALEVSKLKEFLGVDKPTVITVSFPTIEYVIWTDPAQWYVLGSVWKMQRTHVRRGMKKERADHYEPIVYIVLEMNSFSLRHLRIVVLTFQKTCNIAEMTL